MLACLKFVCLFSAKVMDREFKERDRKAAAAEVAAVAKLAGTGPKAGAGLLNNNLGAGGGGGGGSPTQQSPPGSPGSGTDAKPSVLFKKVPQVNQIYVMLLK